VVRGDDDGQPGHRNRHPAVALNLYVAANLAGISMERISRAAVPFVLALMGSLLIITYIPPLPLAPATSLGLR